MFDTEDTIVAIASPHAPGLRGIVRVCGPKAVELLAQNACFEQNSCSNKYSRSEPMAMISPSQPRRYVVELKLAAPFQPISADCFVWPTARSYPGQPVVEVQLPGSIPLLEACVAQFINGGARAARPGEFTLRAFLAGRLDLVQCEAVLAVIDAQGSDELRQALTQLAGGLTTNLDDARNRLLDLLAEIEAGLDFADEDLDLISSERLQHDLAIASGDVDQALSRMSSQRLAQHSLSVVLYGLPNAGKSSLLNALTEQQSAIVSDQAGTTRDWIAVQSVIDGTPIQWIDTAGLDPSRIENAIDEVAQRQTGERLQQSDLRLLCIDLSCTKLGDWELTQLTQAGSQANALVIGTKADQANPSVVAEVIHLVPSSILTSSPGKVGLSEIREQIKRRIGHAADQEASRLGFISSTAQRCQASLTSAAESLRFARELVGTGQDELLAAELRVALDALGEVTGRVYTDDVLDRIFSRFCIGK